MSREISGSLFEHENLESDTARTLLGWGIEAHRDMEAKELLRPYDAGERRGKDFPLEMRVGVRWEEMDPYELEE